MIASTNSSADKGSQPFTRRSSKDNTGLRSENTVLEIIHNLHDPLLLKGSQNL